MMEHGYGKLRDGKKEKKSVNRIDLDPLLKKVASIYRSIDLQRYFYEFCCRIAKLEIMKKKKKKGKISKYNELISVSNTCNSLIFIIEIWPLVLLFVFCL